MICVTVAPRSRTLARADLFNAAGRGDLIELCLDHLIKEPNVAELIEGFNKPILISCRRLDQGGEFRGTEEERQILLRQAIVAGPAYIELEADIAAKIPRFGQTRRVISFTDMKQPLSDIEGIVKKAKELKADVIKLTWPTPTLESTWNLMAAVSRKGEIPVVGMGLGPAGVMLSLLSRKYGSPWIYAALEKGLESFKGQATVFDLDEIFGWRGIDTQTHFVGVVGYTSRDETLVRVLNAGFDLVGQKTRCLPLALEQSRHLPKMLDFLKMNALYVCPKWGSRVLGLAQQMEPAVRQSQHTDLLIKQDDGWHAYHALWRSALKGVEAQLQEKRKPPGPGEKSLLSRSSVLVLGANGLGKVLGYGLAQEGSILSIAAPEDAEAQQAAQFLQARYVSFASVYSSVADLVILADDTIPYGSKRGELNATVVGMNATFVDLSQLPLEGQLAREVRARSVRCLDPMSIYAYYIGNLFRSISGGLELPPEAYQRALQE